MVVEEIGERAGGECLLRSDVESVLREAINDDEDGITTLVGTGVDSWWQSRDEIGGHNLAWAVWDLVGLKRTLWFSM